MGGIWAEGLGEQRDDKAKGVEVRCRDVERRVWPGIDDAVHYEQLRALEANAVADAEASVDRAARAGGQSDAERERLVRSVGALADAAKETMLAHRAADRVKRDLDLEPEKLTADEVDSVASLRAHAKLKALLELDAGNLSVEAHALGMLLSLDRVEMARGLPKHLKLYALADTLHILFGVPVPDVPQDATKKLVPGTWLRFLSDVAASAGHPAPEGATPKQRDAMAWAGMLGGFSDKLVPDEKALDPSSDLARVVAVAVYRLKEELKAQQAAEGTVRLHSKP
jgi:hypothetical protein